jgi:hypothetical protein
MGVDWKTERPLEYRVVEGDTLWSIAGRFLNRPWEWPEVWRGNSQIGDPDRIYPGDVIVLDTRLGAPVLRLQGAVEERLSPRIRVTPLAPPVPVVPLKTIGPFLTRPQVIDAEALEKLPYVVELSEEHVLGGPGDRLYVRSIHAPEIRDYSIIRPGREYIDPDTRAVLGREAIYIGEGYLEATGDPSQVLMTRAEKEARAGDRLTPTPRIVVGSDFKPHAARKGLAGRIISVIDGVTQIGQFSVVALNRGRMDGVETGHVFEIWQKGPEIRDTVISRSGDSVAGPERRAGVLMVFLTYNRVSFALVMNAERFIHVQDIVRAP